MKKVFSSNSALAHAWANQLQSEGRGSSMFFYGDTIYSYGYHYQIAKLVTAPNGQRVCFINSNGYSTSTAKHTRHVWNAIPDGVLLFSVPFSSGNQLNVGDLQGIVGEVMKQANALIEKQIKARSDFRYFIDASNKFNELVEICDLFDLTLPELPETWREAKDKSDNIRATQSEREEEKQRKKLEKARELVAKWLNYEYNQPIYDIPVQLRISKDGKLIQTTKGAEVPLSDGLELLAKLRKGDNVRGYKLAGFSVVSNDGNTLKIGCHDIAWEVINQLFKGDK